MDLNNLFSVKFVVTPLVIGLAAAAVLGAILVLVMYFRWQNKKKTKKKQQEVGSPLVAGSINATANQSPSEARTLKSRNSQLSGRLTDDGSSSIQQSLLSPSGAAVRKVRREPASLALIDWGDDIHTAGFDLGSYSVKGSVCKGDTFTELPTKRSVVSLVEEGVVIGDVEVAMESPASSFFSLTRDLSAVDTVVLLDEIEVYPYQALGGLMLHMLGEKYVCGSSSSRLPPIAVCVPMYLQHIAQYLYLVANTISASRFLIFAHSAACIASLLRQRQLTAKRQQVKPPRNVVFVDFGRSGVVGYVCEVRESSGTVRFQTFRSAGIQNMENRMVFELSVGLESNDEAILARIIEAARDIKEDFASVPGYLAATKRKSSVTINVPTVAVNDPSQLVVEMSRETFDSLCELALADLNEVAEDIKQWMQQNLTGGLEDAELALIGQGFRHRTFRAVFENLFDKRFTSIDKVNVSQGLAQLIAMRHPNFNGQRFDIEPLFQLPTVDEVGVRRYEPVPEEAGGGLLAATQRRLSSRLEVSKQTAATRSSESLLGTASRGAHRKNTDL